MSYFFTNLFVGWYTFQLLSWYIFGLLNTYLNKEEILNNINEPLEIWEGQTKLTMESINVAFLYHNGVVPSNGNVPADILIYHPQKHQSSLGSQHKKTLVDNIEKVSGINIEIPSLHTVYIKVRNAPKASVYTQNIGGELLNFQIIMPKEGKTILKIDTTLASNQRIVNMYRDPARYEIIHILNFQTRQRLIKESE